MAAALDVSGSSPSARAASTLIRTGTDSAILFGGHEAGGAAGDMYVLNLEDLVWEVPKKITGPVPQPCYQHTACLGSDGNVYVYGGTNGDGTFYNETFILNPENTSWSRPRVRGTHPIARAGHTATVVGNRIYYLGGYYFMKTQPCDVTYLDTSRLEWVTVDAAGEPPSPRHSHSATLVGDSHIVVFGGFENKVPLGDIHVLDLTAMQWSSPVTSGTPPSARGEHLAFAYPGSAVVFVCGGRSGKKTIEGDVHSFNCITNEWRRVGTMSEFGGPDAIAHAAWCELPGDGSVFLFGGSHFGRLSGTAYCVTVDLDGSSGPTDVGELLPAGVATTTGSGNSEGDGGAVETDGSEADATDPAPTEPSGDVAVVGEAADGTAGTEAAGDDETDPNDDPKEAESELSRLQRELAEAEEDSAALEVRLREAERAAAQAEEAALQAEQDPASVAGLGGLAGNREATAAQREEYQRRLELAEERSNATEASIADLEQRMEAAKAAKADAKATLEALADSAAEIETIEKRAAELELELKDGLASLEGATSLTQEIEELYSELEKAEEEMGELADALAEQIVEKEAAQETIEAEYAQLKDSYESDTTSLRAELEELSEKAAEVGDVEALELTKANAARAAECKGVRLRIEQDSARALEAEQVLESLQSDVSDLEAEIADLTSEVDRLKQERDEANDTLEKRGAKLEALEQSFKQAQANGHKAQLLVAKLRAQSEFSLESLAQTEEALSKAQAKMDDLQQEMDEVQDATAKAEARHRAAVSKLRARREAAEKLRAALDIAVRDIESGKLTTASELRTLLALISAEADDESNDSGVDENGGDAIDNNGVAE